MRARTWGLLAVGVLLTGCATTVDGAAQPVAVPTSTGGVAAGEPCALLTAEEVADLGLVGEGEFTPGEPGRLLPPVCTWSPEDTAEQSSLTVSLATDLSVSEYVGGVEPAETAELGGRSWRRYLDPVGGESVCQLVTELSATSFVAVTSLDVTEEKKSCELAKRAAPYVAGHLPRS
ncbi:uncharacterized protein DUF3558 [Prauserella shujinwangii]|uniref:Uncharacterized protein DUF3558 n=1 Tax=Prauserella shujinwangii TaxID=1453103 RepID=A0A2T0LVN3_9PSEU|nr:DUF3558 family protein [Prauserella shujinwangii]PRX47911.1 uncharacterized protein DUF3558 [Prauserella shujinwangii]